MRVGIVGHEAAKFTEATEAEARRIIRALLKDAAVMVSGHCHLGGVDIWAEEEADALGVQKLVFPPKILKWDGGYKQRNLLIAEHSDVVHCLVVAAYPPGYFGMRFSACYHCGEETPIHIKSGGCWTAKRAKVGRWHVIGATP